MATSCGFESHRPHHIGQLRPRRTFTMKNVAPAERQDAAPYTKAKLRVAVAGLGAIGLKLAEALDQGIAGCVLSAVSANDRDKAATRLSHLGHPVPVVTLAE